MDQDGIRVERAPPEDVFGLLGNETRVAILRALADEPEEPKSFSALRERVGTRDSGKFNYHLGKLVGRFVRRDDDGYRLTLAGTQVVGALLAGTYTADAELDPIEVGDPCPRCGESPLRVEYADERVRMHCPACEAWSNTFSFPPGAVDQYAREELPAAFDRWLRTTFQRVVAGFCPTCAGRVDGRLDIADEGPDPARARFECRQCGTRAESSPYLPLTYHPAFLGFCYDRGIDVTATPSWRVANGRDELDVDLASTDPPRVRVTVVVDGDALTAAVDEDASVTVVDRPDG